MSNLELIETLCDLVEQQNDAIRQLAVALESYRQLTDEEERACEIVSAAYRAVLGAEEFPNFL